MLLILLVSFAGSLLATLAVIASAHRHAHLSADHDLSGLKGHRLRTHGGLSEAKVPFILSHPINETYRLKAGTTVPKSYQIYDFAINGTRNCP